MTYIISAFVVTALELWAIFAIAGLLPPSRTERSWPIDNFDADGWSGETRQIVYGVSRLRDSKHPGLFILGSSVARESYRPIDLKALLPEFGAQNLSKGGPNIHEIAEGLEHLGKALPPATRNRSIVVITLQVHFMVTNDVRWHKSEWVPQGYRGTSSVVTDLEREALRCGTICTAGSAAFTFLPAAVVNGVKAYFLQLCRFQEWLPDSLTNWVKSRAEFLRAFAMSRNPASRPQPTVAPAPTSQQWMIAELQRFERIWFLGNVSTLQDEQFIELWQLVARARELDFKVVLADTPVGSWVSEQWPTLMRIYQQKMATTVAALTSDPLVAYVDLSSSAPDAEFFDPNHPLPAFRSTWSRRLVEAIRPALRRWH
jgi:hypothetical protein